MFGDLTTLPRWTSGVPHAWNPQFHLKPSIKKIHEEIETKNENGLFLDVWWFNNPASVELSGPSLLKPQFNL
jgi:hypothetical protein